MKVWEAARATFAFPRYFKPFHKVETQRNYIAATNNFACPARVAHQEAHLIWNDIAVEPDIFLSFGTGRNAQAATLPQNHRPPQRPDSIDITPAGFTRSPLLMHIISKTFLGQAASGIDPERIWEEFITSDLAHNDHRLVGDSHRHIRINPKLTMDAPKIDDVKQIEQLEREVEEVMYQDSTRIKEIAHRLLTSSFFFEKNIDSVRRVGDRYTCSGFICCRFEQSSTEIEGLGDVLYTCLKGDFKPYFLIEEQDHPGSPAFAAILTETVIRNMRRGYFDLGIIKLEVSKEHSSVNISLCLQTVAYASGATSLPISGFPRQLISEDATCVASNINSTLLNDQPSNYDSKPHKPDVNKLVLLSRVPKEPMGIVELSETTAPTPELEGGRGLFELGS